MASWVVLQPPADKPDKDLVFVRDDFRWLGLIAPPLWLAWHRLWLEALIVLAVLIGINVLAASGYVAPIISWLSPLVGLFVALEGPAMRIAGLRRRGYAETVALIADTIDEAELRYVGWLNPSEYIDAPKAVSQTPPPKSADGQAKHHAPAMGLFSYPGRS